MITRPDIAMTPHVLSDTQQRRVFSLVAAWFADHAEMDRPRFLKLLDEAKAVAR